jgi:transcriptional regulator GlxA family with amidase domain
VIRRIAVLTYPRVLGTSITIPLEMLYAADVIQRIKAKPHEPLRIELVSQDGSPASLTTGLRLTPTTSLTAAVAPDLIILPAMWGNPLGSLLRDSEVLDWLLHHAGRGCLFCAIGTGSFFLAEAGLLHGKVATTHWYYFSTFENRYPEVHCQRERFITRAGQIYCAGSVNSVRDVMLHFIEQDYGSEIAGQVSQHFTHEIKSTYTTQFLHSGMEQMHGDETIVEVQDWLHNQFHRSLTLQEIANQFELSVRTLNRRFKLATGTSPIHYLQQIRLNAAKELLRNTNLSIAEVAVNCGYLDNSYFAAQFKLQMGKAPSAYRELVRPKLFSVNETQATAD